MKKPGARRPSLGDLLTEGSTFTGRGAGAGLRRGEEASGWWGRGFRPQRQSVLGMDRVLIRMTAPNATKPGT